MASEDETPRTTGKFFTASRSVKQLLGALPDGTVIWGGPYTLTQFSVGALVLVAALITRGRFWGGPLVLDILYIAAATYGAVWVTGKIPSSRRSVVNIGNCCWELLFAPVTGRYRNREVPVKKLGVRGVPEWAKRGDKQTQVAMRSRKPDARQSSPSSMRSPRVVSGFEAMSLDPRSKGQRAAAERTEEQTHG